MDNIILGKSKPDSDTITELVYSDPTKPKFIQTVIVNNTVSSNKFVYFITAQDESNITEKDYFQSEEIEANDTVYVNLNINLKGKQSLFVKSDGDVIFTAIGNG